MPKLFYVDLSLPIHIRTDASDYGIGRYIFQLDQQHELPIRFISKALHKTQLNWSNRFTTASYTPMEVLNIDTIGPVSRDSDDNCYIQVIIDCLPSYCGTLSSK
jgi:hypothetical protein